MSAYTNIFKHIGTDAKKIFSLIQKNGPQTKNSLSSLAGMKLTTLIRAMQPLIDLGLIVESYIGESTGGRKPILYDINERKYYMIGIDISRIYTKVIITNLKLESIFIKQFDMDISCTPEKTTQLVVNIVHDALIQLKIQKHEILGAGVGTVGPIDREQGVILNPDHFISQGWKHVPIRQMFEKALECPGMVDNGANVAVLAEALYGRGKGYANVAYFNCGIGIRTGAIASGNIIRTMNDVEDAFGHMMIDAEGELCSCGNRGCIESYASILSITQKYMFASGYKSAKNIHYTEICAAAEKNDALARAVIVKAGQIFGMGLANFIHLLNPSLIILSGPLINHSDLFYQAVCEAARSKLYRNIKEDITFCKGGQFEEHAIAVGSAALVVETYCENPILVKTA